jgi:hypothetical protein
MKNYQIIYASYHENTMRENCQSNGLDVLTYQIIYASYQSNGKIRENCQTHGFFFLTYHLDIARYQLILARLLAHEKSQ